MNVPLFSNCGHCVPGVDEDCGCSILVARKCAWKSFAGCSSSSKISSDLFPALLDSLTRIRLWRLRWILWNVWKERKTVFFCNCSLHNVKDRLSIFIVHFTRNKFNLLPIQFRVPLKFWSVMMKFLVNAGEIWYFYQKICNYQIFEKNIIFTK